MIKCLVVISFLFLLGSCSAGNEQFTVLEPAGFFWGLWHGIISFISLIIHVFNESVVVYESNNTGGWYDFGFLLGVAAVYGGGSKYCCKSPAQKKREKDWDEIGSKVEIKIMRKLKEWADEEENVGGDSEWKDIGEKVEKKLKQKIREWADKD